MDTDASHDLIIAPGSDLTADRILTLTTGDAARTITLSGNPTLDDWFDQSVKIAASPTFGGLTIFDPIPILILKDSTYAGDVSLGYIEWRDSNNTRLGFFGNASSGNDDLFWKNESSGGHIEIETTGVGEVQIFANTVIGGTLTVSTIAAESSDVDKFLVDSTGVIKYRTGAQVLSDIGGSGSEHDHDATYQPLDAELTSLAALSYVAASFVKMTGANTFALRTLQETSDDLEATIDHDNLLNFAANEHYLQSAIVATGALNSGSITSGFGAIDIGSSALASGTHTVIGGVFLAPLTGAGNPVYSFSTTPTTGISADVIPAELFFTIAGTPMVKLSGTSLTMSLHKNIILSGTGMVKVVGTEITDDRILMDIDKTITPFATGFRLTNNGAGEVCNFSLENDTTVGTIFQLPAGAATQVNAVPGASFDYTFFANSADAETKEVRIYGFPTGIANKYGSFQMVDIGGANHFQISTEDAIPVSINRITKIGDGTNELQVSTTGDAIFVGTGGLCYGEIYATDASDTITIALTGKANKVQITSFMADGGSNNITPDHTNDHITITKAGHYLCLVSLHAVSVGGGGADNYGYSVYKNNGTTEFTNLHGQRDLAGGGGDEGSMSLSGIIDCPAPVTQTDDTYAFVEGGGGADTITDSDAQFLVDGYSAGQTIVVSGSASNNGTYTIDTVVAGTITLIATDDLAAEGAGATVTITGYNTIEVWIWNNTNDDNIVIDDINLSLVQIGGT